MKGRMNERTARKNRVIFSSQFHDDSRDFPGRRHGTLCGALGVSSKEKYER